MKVGIVGLGHVGRIVQRRLQSVGVEVVGYDIRDGGPYPAEELKKCVFVQVCVGTPMTESGAADVSQVESAVDLVPNDKLLLRSTIPPGTTDAIAKRTGKEVAFCPEYEGESRFLGGNSWELDGRFQIIAGRPEARRFFIDHLVEIYGPQTLFFQCSAVEGELIKYMENAYFATKVAFVGELARLASALGADWNTVREGWLLDPRVERDHSAHFPSSPGFSGRCLPKDLAALLFVARSTGLEMPVLDGVSHSNATLVAPQRRDTRT